MVERRNPANLDDLIGYVPRSTRKEMQQAIEAAARALPAGRDSPRRSAARSCRCRPSA